MRVLEYLVHGTDHTGQPFSRVDRFNEDQVRAIGAVLYDDGLPLKKAEELLDHWNQMSRAQGNTLVYSFTEEQLQRNLEAQRVIIAESHRLRQAAEDHCAARLAKSTSVSASDAALRDRRWRLQRIDNMTEDQLLASAQAFAERNEEPVVERPRG